MNWKKDKVHNPIATALMQAGCAVLDLSKLGRGAPDCLCIAGFTMRLFEFKAKYGKFTKDQITWQCNNPRLMQYYRVVKTKEEALKKMGLL
jgi:hypothetical protein